MLFNYYTVESPRKYKHVIMDSEPVVEYIRKGFRLELSVFAIDRLQSKCNNVGAKNSYF